MPVPYLPRAKGVPEPEAAAMVAALLDYARREASSDEQVNATRLRGLHHVLDAARDALDIGAARMNTAMGTPGRLSMYVQSQIMGVTKVTARMHIIRGRELLEGEAS